MNETDLANLRHDLRNPIGQVLGYGEMVLDDLREMERPDLVADIEKIHAAGKRLLALVDERLSAASFGLAAEAEPPQPAPVKPPSVSFPFAFSNESQKESEESGLLLVVDDNEENRDVLARRLQKQGHWAVTAPGGQEALEALAEQPFDLVLLDIMMPRIDGYEVARTVRADPATAALPIIMLSAKAQEADIRKGVEIGVDEYITKPFSPEHLVHVVADYLSRLNKDTGLDKDTGLNKDGE